MSGCVSSAISLLQLASTLNKYTDFKKFKPRDVFSRRQSVSVPSPCLSNPPSPLLCWTRWDSDFGKASTCALSATRRSTRAGASRRSTSWSRSWRRWSGDLEMVPRLTRRPWVGTEVGSVVQIGGCGDGWLNVDMAIELRGRNEFRYVTTDGMEWCRIHVINTVRNSRIYQ